MEATDRHGGSHRLRRSCLAFLVVGLFVATLAADARGQTTETLAQVTLTVVVTGDGEVVSSPEGISCPTDCSGTFDADTTVTLTASPGIGELEGWGDACAGTTGSECQVPLSGDQTASVAFTSPQPPPPPPPGPQPGPPPPPVGPIGNEIDRIIEGLQFGNIAFNSPTELTVGETAVIQLLISGGRPIQDLKQEITALGEREGARIRVSEVVEARLTGLGFEIQAISDERQPVGQAGTTRWSWEIEPTKDGPLRLHLTVSAIVNVRGEQSMYTIQTFERTMQVDVRWSDRVSGFVGDNWQWLWTAIFLPVGAWLLQRRRKAKAAT